ncbi:MAG: UDP-N-acetylmuramoyl-L-alanine--D-glutamate ligase [Lachnospiraceae bacterium]|nr:UDP-N-acetylmuramoyl-L-alanine--D-glutamate ligase [Lachnospiraceae bacterium]
MEFEGKKFLVVGTGKSGVAAAGLLKSKGLNFVLYDGNENLDALKLKNEHEEFSACDIYLGNIPENVMENLDIAVLSPGVPVDLPFVENLKERGCIIWGEIELAYRFSAGKIIAITGTNGKTTTTTLVGEIMKAYFDDVRVVGNIGIPYTTEAATMTDKTVTVAEISSFQLETAVDFHPAVSAILNITPDHLNRHHTMENYIACKESITKNQSGSETVVLNYEDPVLKEFGKTLDINVVYFSSKTELEDGYYLEGENIIRSKAGKREVLLKVSETSLLGNHNYENIMAAMAMAESFGVPMNVIVDTVKRFKAVEHRIEFVEEVDGVTYYNDSKGTNVDAAIQGIKAMVRPTYLIGGGYDKQSEYDEWIEAFDGKVKKLVLIGQTKEKIKECANRHGFYDVVLFDTFEEAVSYCHDNAKAGEAVLLSPACASWGMFDNYEERGRIFKELVRNM